MAEFMAAHLVSLEYHSLLALGEWEIKDPWLARYFNRVCVRRHGESRCKNFNEVTKLTFVRKF